MLRLLLGCLLIVLISSCSPKQDHIQEFREDGTLEKEYSLNKDSLLNGTLVSYYDNGTSLFEEANYIEGKLNGSRKIYYESGKVEIIENYHNDLLTDTLRVYYPSGSLKRKEFYDDGVLLGTLTSYYENGQEKEVVNYADNLENGPFTEYYENGHLKWSGQYLDGDNEIGELLHYDSTGTLVRKLMCDSLSICKTIWTLEEESISNASIL